MEYFEHTKPTKTLNKIWSNKTPEVLYEINFPEKFIDSQKNTLVLSQYDILDMFFGLEQ